MKILLLTNHLAVYAGSEIQILELYRYFKSQNHGVFVYANYIRTPIRVGLLPPQRFRRDLPAIQRVKRPLTLGQTNPVLVFSSPC